MTNTTNFTSTVANDEKVTRKDALVAAIAKFDSNDPVRATLEKMLEQVTKPRNGETPAQTKAKAERESLMLECVNVMKQYQDDPINSTWLAHNVDGVRSTQKATVLMGNAIKAGLVEKYYEGKRVYYRAI